MKAVADTGTVSQQPSQKADSWTVVLLDDDAAARIAESRSWDSENSHENHVLYVEGTEAEISFTFHTLEEAMEFAESNYSCAPPNWPTVQNDSGELASYDGVDWHWEYQA